MMILFAISALICLSAAQHGPTSYDYDARPGADPQLQEALDFLEQAIDTIEQKQEKQQNRIAVIADAANANEELEDNFQMFIRILGEAQEKYQSKRLDEIEKKNKQIIKLGKDVKKYNKKANVYDSLVAKYRDILKQDEYEIRCLQNADTDSFNRIEETRQRADDVEESVDALKEKVTANDRSLDVARLRVLATIDAVNREEASQEVVTVDVASDPVQYINYDFLGRPQFSMISANRFHAKNDGTYYGYEYPTGYVEVDSFRNRTVQTISAVDMSAGGWAAESAVIYATNMYFDRMYYPKSFLDNI